MKKKKFKKNISNFCGLEYLTVKAVPMVQTAHGEFMDVDPLNLERMAAWAILNYELPIRGKELKIIRGALDLSLAKFARNFDKDAGTILKWEQKPLARLSLADELLVRIFASEQLGIKLPTFRWSHVQHLANQKIIEPLAVDYKTA
ncbi:MAG: hypothetical protein ACXVCP_18935 [Bdellovibrio sp.]